MELKEMIEKYATEFIDIMEYVYDHAELGNEEVASSQYLVEKLKEHGFQVEYPYLEMKTAFRAEFKMGEGKKIAFLPEYDALPGYGPNHDLVRHACGHNWIAASTLGAAIALSKLDHLFDGTIVVIGTPAEETTGGKCELVDKGAFSDIDGAIQMHLGAENNINVRTLAMDSIEFNFKGLASHYAAYPEKGINALDAAMLMMQGTNALIKHLRRDSSVGGIITNGGAACNTVPDLGSVRYYIRANDKEYLHIITNRIIDCARGAALMTGCELEYHNFENSYDNLVYDETLRSLLKKNLSDLGVVDFIPEDLESTGSSDIGNVSHVCPTVYCEIDTGANPKVFAHNEDFLDYVHGKNAYHTLFVSIQAMAQTAIDYNKL